MGYLLVKNALECLTHVLFVDAEILKLVEVIENSVLRDWCAQLLH